MKGAEMRKLVLLALAGVAIFLWTCRALDAYAASKITYNTDVGGVQYNYDPQQPAAQCLQNCSLVLAPPNVMNF
jgi:hypothetical protein